MANRPLDVAPIRDQRMGYLRVQAVDGGGTVPYLGINRAASDKQLAADIGIQQRHVRPEIPFQRGDDRHVFIDTVAVQALILHMPEQDIPFEAAVMPADGRIDRAHELLFPHDV